MPVKQPQRPLSPQYRPTGGISYKVRDGDSWWSLAAKSAVNPWWLVQYNFETRDPDEVNWYLRDRVGCTKKTPDGNNFVFSQAAQPGIIYLPAPNTVRAHKDLAYEQYGIIIDGNKDYRARVRATLGLLASSDTGLVLLKAIKRTGKEIEISPWTGTTCNATAASTDVRNATSAGLPVLDGGFKQAKEPSALRELLGLPQEVMMGTGEGSNGRIRMSPAMFGFGATGPCAGFAGSAGASPSQVLFHELAHAYRYASGKFHPRPTVGGSAGYTNMEEFFAVVLSNVLISDPTYSSGHQTLRADHAGFAPLAPALSTSRGFVNHPPNRNMMRELVQSDPALAKALSGVQSTFNPFAESL
jgi:hypothetical protein